MFKSQGLEIEKVEHTKLLETVEEHVNNGYKLVHPIDDKGLICGYSSLVSFLVPFQKWINILLN